MSVAKLALTDFPKRIALDQIGDAFLWRGTVAFSRFQRLVDEVDHADVVYDMKDITDVQLNCTLSSDDNQLFWLNVSTVGALPQQCQRCLTKVMIPLELDACIALTTSESVADRLLDDDADFIVLTETHGLQAEDNALSIDLLRVIEDELLLILPISPKHDDCELTVTSVGEIEETPTDNPFAQLADLKGKLGD